jgi:GNAT superfamily N-acetyltransferase
VTGPAGCGSCRRSRNCHQLSCATLPTSTTTTTRRSARWITPGGRGVGIARYVRDADDPQAAAIAVTIVDDWQGRGLGTELVAQLSDRARSAGIRRFTALVAADNPAMTGLLRNVRADLVRHGPGALQYEITLGPAGWAQPGLAQQAWSCPPGTE